MMAVESSRCFKIDASHARPAAAQNGKSSIDAIILASIASHCPKEHEKRPQGRQGFDDSHNTKAGFIRDRCGSMKKQIHMLSFSVMFSSLYGATWPCKLLYTSISGSRSCPQHSEQLVSDRRIDLAPMKRQRA